jgi:hypothetical protein
MGWPFLFQRKEKPMKEFLIILIVTTGVAHGGIFSKDAEREKERRLEAESRSQQLEQQLQKQRERTERWQTAAGSLAVGCVVLLSVGTAIGSKVRTDGHHS